MKTFRITAVIIAALLLGGAARGESHERSKNFKVNKGGKLSVSVMYGDIDVDTWDRNEIEVKYDEDEGEESLKYNQDGNNVSISAGGGWSYPDLKITVPANFNVSVKTQAGDLNFKGNINGRIEAMTSGGDITLEKSTGQILLKTSGGDVKANDIKGDIKVESSGGDIKMGKVDGNAELKTAGGNMKVGSVSKDLTLSSGGGNISAGDVGGRAAVATGGGNIAVGSVGSDAKITTGGGNVKLNGAKGRIKVNTGSGNLDLYKLSGMVHAITGSGNANIEIVNLTGESEIRSYNGDIKLYINENTNAVVEARVKGSWGDSDEISSDFDSVTENKRKGGLEAEYKIGTGGKRIVLESNSGRIEVRKQK